MVSNQHEAARGQPRRYAALRGAATTQDSCAAKLVTKPTEEVVGWAPLHSRWELNPGGGEGGEGG